MNSSTMNDFDDLHIIKKYQVFSNGQYDKEVLDVELEADYY